MSQKNSECCVNCEWWHVHGWIHVIIPPDDNMGIMVGICYLCLVVLEIVHKVSSGFYQRRVYKGDLDRLGLFSLPCNHSSVTIIIWMFGEGAAWVHVSIH